MQELRVGRLLVVRRVHTATTLRHWTEIHQGRRRVVHEHMLLLLQLWLLSLLLLLLLLLLHRCRRRGGARRLAARGSSTQGVTHIAHQHRRRRGILH